MNTSAIENGKEKKWTALDSDKGEFKVSSYGYRHQQCLVIFLCFSTAYTMRACIGVALVGMIDSNYNYTSPANKNSLNTSIANNNSKNNQIYKESVNNSFLVNQSIINNITDEIDDFNEQVNNTIRGSNHSVLFSNDYDDNTTNDNRKEYVTIKILTAKHKSSDTNSRLLHKLLLIPPYPAFQWSKKTQDVIITSFFWGYMSLQIPAGQLVHRFGPKMLLVGAMTINFVISFSFPWAVNYGGYILGCFFRVIQGMSQACIIPGVFGFLGRWAPLEERSRLVGFILSAHAIGTVVGLPVTGFIAASPLGWPGIFRFYGLLSGLVALLVYFTVYDNPAKHPKISEAERRYIEEGLGLENGKKKKNMPVPWKKILTLPALYGIMATHISQTWGQTILFAEIPSFMAKVMGVNIKANGLLTALPFLLMWFANFFFTWLIDWIIIKKYMSVTNARKFANCLGAIPAAAGLIVLAYVPKTLIAVESILIVICVFKICLHVGAMTTHIDIAPNFASTMMSLSNFVSNLVGSQAPLLTGYLLDDVSSEKDWRKVFFVASGLYFFTNIIYLILGTAEKAPWNDPPAENDSEDAPETVPMMKTEQNEKEDKVN